MGLPEINRARILELQNQIIELELEIDRLSGDVGSYDPIVRDENFENITPRIPNGVIAEGLFRSIMVQWSFDVSSYIASYEVYASKNKGFTPRETDLIWRGLAGSYIHQASTNETWYFRVRAVNRHGVASEYSVEASGSTAQIDGFEIKEEYKIDLIEYTNQYTDERKTEIMEEVAKKLDAQVYHDNIILKADQEFVIEELKKKLNQESVQAEIDKAIDELVITPDKIAPGAVGTNHLEAGMITEEKMKWATHLIF